MKTRILLIQGICLPTSNPENGSPVWRNRIRILDLKL